MVLFSGFLGHSLWSSNGSAVDGTFQFVIVGFVGAGLRDTCRTPIGFVLRWAPLGLHGLGRFPWISSSMVNGDDELEEHPSAY